MHPVLEKAVTGGCCAEGLSTQCPSACLVSLIGSLGHCGVEAQAQFENCLSIYEYWFKSCTPVTQINLVALIKSQSHHPCEGHLTVFHSESTEENRTRNHNKPTALF